LALPNVDVFPLRNEHCYYVLWILWSCFDAI